MRKLTMITINVNGTKVPGKSLTLGRFLHQENIDICVAVETHRTTQEAKTLTLEGLEESKIESASCRDEDEGGRIKGGVAIFVRTKTVT